MIDLIDGPETVLAYLCSESNLHRIVSQVPIFMIAKSYKSTIFKQPVVFSPRSPIRESELEHRNHPIKKWIVGDVRFTVSFSERGLRHSTSTSDALRDSRILNSIDSEPSLLLFWERMPADCLSRCYKDRKQIEAKEQELHRLRKSEDDQNCAATRLADTIRDLQAEETKHLHAKVRAS